MKKAGLTCGDGGGAPSGAADAGGIPGGGPPTEIQKSNSKLHQSIINQVDTNN